MSIIITKSVECEVCGMRSEPVESNGSDPTNNDARLSARLDQFRYVKDGRYWVDLCRTCEEARG